MDQEKMLVKIEGNVRVITKDMTLYGSHLEYNLTTGSAKIKNARILTSDFNLVATELLRINEKEYLAIEAEFTTCKDCAESWSIYGKTIRMKMGDSVQIRHGLAKVKGSNVLYLPYISIPIMVKRKTGLLFPEISNRIPEGISFEQPVFVEMGESKDMTVSPMYWAKRGSGGNFQYRQRFRELSWLEFNARTLNDSIYEPGKEENNVSPSGQIFFRHYLEGESHQQWSPNLKSHVRYTDVKDLDMVRVDPIFIEPRTLSSDYGLQGHLDYRDDWYSLSTEADYLRNQLYEDPTKFDQSYVQVLPRVSFSTTPVSILQSKNPMLQHIVMGMDGSYTRFRQIGAEDAQYLRNADRESFRPYVIWNFFSWGPVAFKARYTYDQQNYQFDDHRQESFGKNAGLLQTEASFTMDKIFGLAFEEKVPVKMISERDLKKLREKNEQGLTPLKKTEKVNKLIGELPPFESELSKENIIQVRKSYRHSQEFKFIHHFITGQSTYGNERFFRQISDPNTGQTGWFDFEDAIRKDEFRYGANTTRTIIPPENTVEFQWNNTLIRKTPKPFSYLDDDKYLRDNFTYSRTGYFTLSQGLLVNEQPEEKDIRDKLTRLLLTTGYSTDKWSTTVTESYFHYGKNIFQWSLTRKFEYINLFSAYNYNSFPPPTPKSGEQQRKNQLNSLSVGGQIRPTDVLGFAITKDMDIEAKRDIRTIYSLDIMPNNNCWILSLNYRQSTTVNRYSFNVIWNFGDDNFAKFRDDYFSVKRL